MISQLLKKKLSIYESFTVKEANNHFIISLNEKVVIEFSLSENMETINFINKINIQPLKNDVSQAIHSFFFNQFLNNLLLYHKKRYLEGQCFSFALALSDKFSYQILNLYAVVNEDDIFLVHSFALNNDMVIDITGVQLKDKALNQWKELFTKNNINNNINFQYRIVIYQNSKEAKGKIKNSYFDSYSLAMEIIENNIDFFSIA